MILKYLNQKPATSGPPRTNIPISSSASNENLSVDPDEAIRKRLAELRTDSAASEGTLRVKFLNFDRLLSNII